MKRKRSAVNRINPLDLLVRHRLQRDRLSGTTSSRSARGSLIGGVVQMLLVLTVASAANAQASDWNDSACTDEAVDASGSHFDLGEISLAAPPGVRNTRSLPSSSSGGSGSARTQTGSRNPIPWGRQPSLYFARGSSALRVTLHVDARRQFDEFEFPLRGRRDCTVSLGGRRVQVVAWSERGQFGLLARLAADWGGGDDGKWLLAHLTASSLSDAVTLRKVLATIAADSSRF